jgi:hypothetical protein
VSARVSGGRLTSVVKMDDAKTKSRGCTFPPRTPGDVGRVARRRR